MVMMELHKSVPFWEVGNGRLTAEFRQSPKLPSQSSSCSASSKIGRRPTIIGMLGFMTEVVGYAGTLMALFC